LALLIGAEGTGLTEGARRAASHRVRIPMTPGVDSLNVATALAIALHRLIRPG
jgi:tRNA G18 (ribose-2'-O)-methylase SpoU